MNPSSFDAVLSIVSIWLFFVAFSRLAELWCDAGRWLAKASIFNDIRFLVGGKLLSPYCKCDSFSSVVVMTLPVGEETEGKNVPLKYLLVSSDVVLRGLLTNSWCVTFGIIGCCFFLWIILLTNSVACESMNFSIFERTELFMDWIFLDDCASLSTMWCVI